MNKRNSIAKEIRDLGAGYRLILRDGWGSTTSCRRMLRAEWGRALGLSKPTAMKDRIVVANEA